MKKVLFLAAFFSIFATTGCGTAIKEGAGFAFGPKGAYIQSDMPDLGPKGNPTLERFRSFRVGRVSVDPKFTDFGGVMPQVVISNIGPELARELRKNNIPVAGAQPGCIIRINLFYYEGAGSKGIVFGDVEEVLAEVTLIDVQTRKIVGRAICIGRSTTRVNLGTEKKISGLAHAITKWIKSHRLKKEK